MWQPCEIDKNSENILVHQIKITVTDLVSAFWQEFVAWNIQVLIHNISSSDKSKSVKT